MINYYKIWDYVCLCSTIHINACAPNSMKIYYKHLLNKNSPIQSIKYINKTWGWGDKVLYIKSLQIHEKPAQRPTKLISYSHTCLFAAGYEGKVHDKEIGLTDDAY